MFRQIHCAETEVLINVQIKIIYAEVVCKPFSTSTEENSVDLHHLDRVEESLC